MKKAVKRLHTCIISRDVLEWMRRPESELKTEHNPDANVSSRTVEMMPTPDPESLIRMCTVTPLTRMPDGSMMTQLEVVTLEDT